MGLTLTITGVGPWERRAVDAERLRMLIYMKLIEKHGDDGRCATCAFRDGTPANGSSLVVRCVDNALQTGGSFKCHTHPESDDPSRECTAFTQLKAEYTTP